MFCGGDFDGGAGGLGYAGGEVGEEFGQLGVYFGEGGDVGCGYLAVGLGWGGGGCGPSLGGVLGLGVEFGGHCVEFRRVCLDG